MKFLKRLFFGVQKDLRLFVFILILLEIFRAIFIFWFADEITNSDQVAAALWSGLRLSLKTAGVVALLSFVFVTLGNVLRHLRLIIVFLASLIFSTLFMLRFPYFREYHSTYGIEILQGLDNNFLTILEKIFIDYGFFWRFPVALILSIVCIAIFSRLSLIKTVSLPDFKNKTEQFIFTGALTFFIGALAIFVVLDKPTITNDNFLNEAIWDDGQSLFRVASMSHFMTPGNISHVDKDNILTAAETLAQDESISADNLEPYLEKVTTGAKIEKPRHIFIIIGENLGQWELLGKYDSLHVADGLKSIIAEPNVYYSRNFFPNSNSTLGAISGIVTGLPDLNVYLNYQPKTFRQKFISAFAPPFKELGYKVDFWYGGTPADENFSKMVLAQGFDNFYSYYNLFEMLEKSLAEEPPTVHLVLATNHLPQNLTLAKAGFDYNVTLAKVKKLPNIADAENFTAALGNYWQMDKTISNFIRNISTIYPSSLFVVTGDCAEPPNTHPTIFESQSVPLIIYGVDKNILPPDSVGGHISIAPTIIELIAQEDFKYYSLAPSLFESSGVAFNREFFITENVAGKIDFDAIEILPQVASVDLDSINLAEERAHADKIISAIRTVGWWILNNGLKIGGSDIED